jgi:hypothetical protein
MTRDPQLDGAAGKTGTGRRKRKVRGKSAFTGVLWDGIFSFVMLCYVHSFGFVC